jgi:hypothetical protein
MTTYHPPPQSQAPTTRDAFEHPPRPLAQRLGAILWPSFFAAGVATTVFFAIVDPEDLNAISWADVHFTREGGYTFGFFMFWACTAASSLFTWILLRPRSRFNRPLRDDQDLGEGDEREVD